MPSSIELIRRELQHRFHRSATRRMFGFRLLRVERGRVWLEMEVARRFLQVHGRVHGGILATLADTATALAAYTVVPPRARLATLEMKINFLEGVERGAVTARARVLRAGRTVVVCECDLRDGADRLAAKAMVTLAVSHPPG
ncbi:MAG TPA: PaaI family thioesterase [Candidatus Acidoferrales bacterium]|nr:PaaI family thioesterase [Candidatus Acidoferrales bacterium]